MMYYMKCKNNIFNFCRGKKAFTKTIIRIEEYPASITRLSIDGDSYGREFINVPKNGFFTYFEMLRQF